MRNASMRFDAASTLAERRREALEAPLSNLNLHYPGATSDERPVRGDGGDHQARAEVMKAATSSGFRAFAPGPSLQVLSGSLSQGIE